MVASIDINNSRLFVRADAGPEIGIGHVMRCMALAQAWQRQGGSVTFLCCGNQEWVRARVEVAGFDLFLVGHRHPHRADLQETISAISEQRAKNEISWMILDGYHFDAEYAQGIRATGVHVLVLDDMGCLPRYRADILLNQNVDAQEHKYCCEPDTLLLLGTRYALLRPEFQSWRSREVHIPKQAYKILVTLGGSDPGRMTETVIAALERLGHSQWQARVVVGPANPLLGALQQSTTSERVEILCNVQNMPELMSWADVAVSAGGSTCWELALMGVPMLLMSLAENQRGIVHILEQMRLAVAVEPDAGIAQLTESLSQLMYRQTDRERMSSMGRAMVDGMGADRVVDVLLRYGTVPESDAYCLRFAESGDAFLFWQWANDRSVRTQSFRWDAIEWEAHLAWFSEKLAASNTRIWILEYKGVPVGQIRYDRDESGVAEIGFSVSPAYRNRGIGTKLLQMSTKPACQELGVYMLRGVLFEQNIGSARAFEKAGFKRTDRRVISGHRCQVFCYKNPLGYL